MHRRCFISVKIRFITIYPPPLFLFDVSFQDVNALSGLVNLEMLDLNNTGVTDISPLSNLTNLKTLNLSGNPIEDFSPPDGLPNLENRIF